MGMGLGAEAAEAAAMSNQRGEGRNPNSADRSGFANSAKLVRVGARFGDNCLQSGSGSAHRWLGWHHLCELAPLAMQPRHPGVEARRFLAERTAK